MNLKRFIPLVILGSGLGLALYFDLDKYLSFSVISEHYAFLKNYIDQQLLLSLLVLAIAYILVVSFSIPGATVLSLFYGALLGTWLAGILIVISATLGATMLFLAARYAFQDILKERAGPWLIKMRDGFNKNAVSYMLFLRLVPLFPFFTVNLAPAFMGVSLRVFILTTFFGIIPGTFIFSSIGNGLGSILERGDIPNLESLITMEILLPLAALGILSLIPIIYKKLKGQNTA